MSSSITHQFFQFQSWTSWLSLTLTFSLSIALALSRSLFVSLSLYDFLDIHANAWDKSMTRPTNWPTNQLINIAEYRVACMRLKSKSEFFWITEKIFKCFGILKFIVTEFVKRGTHCISKVRCSSKPTWKTLSNGQTTISLSWFAEKWQMIEYIYYNVPRWRTFRPKPIDSVRNVPCHAVNRSQKCHDCIAWN